VEILRKGDVVLVAQKQTVARYSSLKPSPRPDLLQSLNRAIETPDKPQSNGAVIAVAFCPGPDFRRVVRELWPQLPGVLAPMHGELADRWISLELAVSAPPNPRPRLALQAKDPEAAELFAKLWRDLPTAVTEFGGNEASRKQAQKYAQLLVDTLPPKVDGSRATFDLSVGEEQAAKLSAMFAEAAEKSMEASYRNQKVNQFKVLALAMHNFHDKYKHFPPSAIRDKDGKSLLSWRVAILPYIDQQQLYGQFHLDEPWDSPHNRTLITKIPSEYADPNPRRRREIGDGKTTYQLPVSPETAFGKNDGVKINEITDGTSQTVMNVDVAALNAVEWTRPADWEVDLDQPLRGLEEPNRPYFVVTRCDGSAHVVPMTIGKKTLRALLTRAGGEVPE
jgi:hypothetical protein